MGNLRSRQSSKGIIVLANHLTSRNRTYDSLNNVLTNFTVPMSIFHLFIRTPHLIALSYEATKISCVKYLYIIRIWLLLIPDTTPPHVIVVSSIHVILHFIAIFTVAVVITRLLCIISSSLSAPTATSPPRAALTLISV